MTREIILPGNDNGTYDDLVVPVGALESVFGSPSRTRMNNILVWLMDDTATEAIAGHAATTVPAGWNTVDLIAVWAAATANAGNAALQIYYSIFQAGDTVARTSGTVQGKTAAGQYVAVESTLASGIAVSAGDVVSLELGRIGGNGADTLTGDIGVLALIARKAS